MGPGSLRRAIERKSPMLLHRSIRTGSSIFANYSVTGRSLAHGLCALKRREKRPARAVVSTRLQTPLPAEAPWACWTTPIVSTASPRPQQQGFVQGPRRVRSAFGHDRRRSLALAFADAHAASHAHRDQRCNQSDEKLFHWNPLLISPALTRPIIKT